MRNRKLFFFQQNDEFEKAASLIHLTDIFLKLSRFEEVLSTVDLSLQILDKTNVPELELLAYVQKGKYFLGLKKYHKALLELAKAKKIEMENFEDEFHPEVFELLTLTYQEIGNFKKAFNAQVQFKKYSDSLTKSVSKVEITKENLQYSFKRVQMKDSLDQVQKDEMLQKRLNQILNKKEQAEFQKNGIIVLFVLFLIVGIFVFRIRLKKYQQKKIEKEKEITKIKKVLADSKEHVFSLNETINDKSRQLTSASLSSSHIEHVIEELKNQLRELIHRHEGSMNSDLNKMSNVIRTSKMEKEIIGNFVLQFEGVHPGYLERLLNISPNLSTSDLRICAMMKLNLNSHEISTIQGISVNSLRTIRYRIHKKIGVEKGEKLQDFLLKVG